MIPDGSRVLLDSVVLIYFFEAHPTHGRWETHLLSRIEKGTLQGVLATVGLAEILVGEYRRSKESGRSLRRRVVAQPNLSVIDLTQEIACRAAELRARYNLHLADAIHAATAFKATPSGSSPVISVCGGLKQKESAFGCSMSRQVSRCSSPP